MKKRYNSSDINVLNKRKIFFDANILLYIFWSTGFSKWEKKYSSIFNKLLKQGNEMFVDFIVISEVVNRAIRIEYEKYLQQNDILKDSFPFKSYRNSQDGKEAISDIYNIVRNNILNRFSFTGKLFKKSDIKSFLCNDSLDFSDKGIAAICMENDFVLLTNDKDFISAELEILTSNSVLL